MERLLELVTSVNSVVNSFAWGPVMLVLLVGTGIYLSVRTGFLQVRKFGYILKNTVGSLFTQKKQDKQPNLTPFQAVSTALASTVGTGNIAGVTGAIFVGGPGAVFWMWVSAFFGMCTKYAEIALAVKYRETDEKGQHRGGPMYYIEKGLGARWKPLAIVFAVLAGLASFGIGNIAQSTEIAGTMSSLLHVDPLITGIILAVLVAVVILGGIQRIGQVTSLMVPFMAAFYLLAGLGVLIWASPIFPLRCTPSSPVRSAWRQSAAACLATSSCRPCARASRAACSPTKPVLAPRLSPMPARPPASPASRPCGACLRYL